MEAAAKSHVRSPNQVDFWRGFALLSIFINHLPGHPLGSLTLRNFAICDAAELFVFLAGWSMWHVANRPGTTTDPIRLTGRLWLRALDLYRAQLALQGLALAILAGAALHLSNPLYLEWHNAGPAFYDPSRTAIGVVLLTYQLGYFNILPMYVVLMLMAPALVLAASRLGAAPTLALSLGLYGWALTTGATMPSWPAEEQWYFNPLCWQLLLLLGYLMAGRTTSDPEAARRLALRLLPITVAIAIIGTVVTVANYRPDPYSVPSPRLLFLFDKTYLSPARLLNLLALAMVAPLIYPFLARVLGRIWIELCALGRNSLPVFCFGSIASLVGQIWRFEQRGQPVADFVIILAGVLGMVLVAWLVEWRRHALR